MQHILYICGGKRSVRYCPQREFEIRILPIQTFFSLDFTFPLSIYAVRLFLKKSGQKHVWNKWPINVKNTTAIRQNLTSNKQKVLRNNIVDRQTWTRLMGRGRKIVVVRIICLTLLPSKSNTSIRVIVLRKTRIVRKRQKSWLVR